jgi:hypothetical protein
LLGSEEVHTYQLNLIGQKKASRSAFDINVSALRFLYTVSLEREWAFEKIPYASLISNPVALNLALAEDPCREAS